jgi:hypothetical protein
VVERFEIRGEARLGRAVEHHGLAAALPRHRAEHAQRAAAFRQQPLARGLAEEQRAGEVRVEHLLEERRVGLELLLRREQAARHDHGVEAGERALGRRERRLEARGRVQVAQGGAHRAACAAHFQVASAALQVLAVAAEHEELLAARGEQARQRPADALGRAEQDRLHAGSPSTRTDCALRSLNSGSHLRRIRSHPGSRGSIAR